MVIKLINLLIDITISLFNNILVVFFSSLVSLVVIVISLCYCCSFFNFRYFSLSLKFKTIIYFKKNSENNFFY